MTRIGDWTDEKHTQGRPEDCPVCIREKVVITNTPRGPDDPRHDPDYREKIRVAKEENKAWIARAMAQPQPRLETDSDKRKEMPIYSGVIRYFPDALAEIAKLSKIGNDKHNPGQPLHWSRGKSTDHLDCVVRHLAEAGTIDEDGLFHDVKVAWRALANLQTLLERERGLHISPGSKP